MGINPKDNNPDPAFGVTEWPAPPVQRQPEEPPYKEPAPKVPFYKQPADPMPAMKEWYEKALAKQQAEEGVLGSGT
jgi:hypothetical protein